MESTASIPPITEDDIALFLVNTPGFFERHAEVLASVQLTSPHGQRAVSLQERQAEMLREKIRHLELKSAEMIRYGHENVAIADHLHAWSCALLKVREPAELPACMLQGLSDIFQVPQAALRLWSPSGAVVPEPWQAGVTPDVQAFAQSLEVPYCGGNPGLDVVQWLDQPQAAASVALLPLRPAVGAPAFGLMLLASHDERRFHSQMGTAFLQRMADLASAALGRLVA